MGHKHAQLMAQYAKDAAEHEEPWRNWEYRVTPNSHWVQLKHNPGWSTGVEYRRKPEKLKVYIYRYSDHLYCSSTLPEDHLRICEHSTFVKMVEVEVD